MARVLLLIKIIAFVAFAAVQCSVALECSKPNEEKKCVAECPPQKTCRTRNIQVSCLQEATENCKDACICKEGFYRNLGGECVSSDDCDQCPAQNQYYSYRTQPDELCSDLKKTDSAEDQPTATDNGSDQTTDGSDSNGKCYCAPGNARDENNVCVPYDQCNQPCGSDETKVYCPSDCTSDDDYCPKTEEVKSCPQPQPCPKPKCVCRFNYSRLDNGTCIPTRDCPPFECKKPFEEYNPCPPICPNGYCGQATPTGRCPPLFGRIGIVLECKPRCRCQKGYWWNENKVCIPYNQCRPQNKDRCTLKQVLRPQRLLLSGQHQQYQGV